MSELLHRYGEAMERKRLADEAALEAQRAVNRIAGELARLLSDGHTFTTLASSAGEQRATDAESSQ